MKQMSTASLAATFAGCMLGAGYVSGREVYQFFGAFGINGLWSLALAMLFFMLFGAGLLFLSKKTGISQMDKIVVPWNVPALRVAMGIAEELFLFVICMTMIAAFGAMISQLTGASPLLGSGAITVLIAILALGGQKRMIAVFSLFVPLLVIASVVICILVFSRSGITLPQEGQSGWGLSGLTFLSYNLFCSIGILAPLGNFLGSRKKIWGGLALGTLALSALSFGILLSLFVFPEASGQELPMLSVATEISGVLGIVYAVLMCGAILGSSLSCTVSMGIYLEQKNEFFKKHRVAVILVLLALAFGGSLFGFSNLVATVFPVFGYIGFAAIILLAVHFFRAYRKKA